MAAYAAHVPPPDFALQLVAFTVGITILHGAACVINDICDIEFDKRVALNCLQRPAYQEYSKDPFFVLDGNL